MCEEDGQGNMKDGIVYFLQYYVKSLKLCCTKSPCGWASNFRRVIIAITQSSRLVKCLEQHCKCQSQCSDATYCMKHLTAFLESLSASATNAEFGLPRGLL